MSVGQMPVFVPPEEKISMMFRDDLDVATKFINLGFLVETARLTLRAFEAAVLQALQEATERSSPLPTFLPRLKYTIAM